MKGSLIRQPRESRSCPNHRRVIRDMKASQIGAVNVFLFNV